MVGWEKKEGKEKKEEKKMKNLFPKQPSPFAKT
jgi:hypothetical protein